MNIPEELKYTEEHEWVRIEDNIAIVGITDFALNREMLKNRFPFSILNGRKVNTLIFPNLDSANITYKIIKELDRSVSVGPILIGLNKPIHILQLGASVDEIVNMAAVSVIDANQRKIKK